MPHPMSARPKWLIERAGARLGGGGRRDVSMLTTACLDALATWISRRRQRLDIAELAERNDYLLQDIGVSRRGALHEAAKPFWIR